MALIPLCVCVCVSVCVSLQINAVFELRGENTQGLPTTINKLFQPLPYPEDITVTAANPHLIRTGPSYRLSTNITTSYEQPGYGYGITHYEVAFSDVPLQVFDRFNEYDLDRLISGELTQFQTHFSEDISGKSLQILVQVCI